MAKISQDDQTSVKEFRKSVDAKLRDSQALDEANQLKKDALVQQMEAQEKTIADEELIYDRMKADFLAQGRTRKDKLLKDLAAAAEKFAKEFDAGKHSINEHLAFQDETKTKTAEGIQAIDAELAQSLALIRQKHLRVLKLKVELLKMKQSFFYFEAAAPEIGLRDIEQLLKTLSARRQNAAEGTLHVNTELRKVQDELDRATRQGKGMVGDVRWSLDLAGVRALRFLASIPEQYSAMLERTIGEIEAFEKEREKRGQQPGVYRVQVDYVGARGPVGDVSWTCENKDSFQIVRMGMKNRDSQSDILSLSNATDPKPAPLI